MQGYSWSAWRSLLLAALTLVLSFYSSTSRAADYTVGADLSNGIATLWFKSNVGSSWVDAHYNVNGGAQQNVRMTYNSTLARFETKFSASAGQVVNHSFTYNVGGAAYDSPSGSTTLSGSGGGGTAAAPTFNPPGGSYASAQSVSLASATSGATIRYTTDGSTPTSSSAVYSGPIAVSANRTIRAFASASGMTDSAVSAATYTIGGGGGGGGTGYTHGVDGSGASVTLWFQGGSGVAWVDAHYNAGSGQQNVRMTYNSGTGRHESAVAVPTGSTSVTYSFTYFTNGTGAADTPVFTATIGGGGGGGGGGTVATPSFSPNGGSFNAAQSVTISSTTSGAAIHYTTNGATPTTSSPLYTGPVTVSATSTLKAIAVKSGMTDSAVGSASFTITGTPGSFVHGVSELGATATIWFKTTSPVTTLILHYRVGSGTQIDPTMAFNSSLGRYEFVLNNMTAGKVINYSFTYAFTGSPQQDSAWFSHTFGAGGIARPSFTPDTGTYPTAQQVSITSNVSGAAIRYTLDGTAPNASSPLYTGPISVSTAATINAINVLPDGRESALASASYVISTPGGKVATPTFSRPSGTHGTPFSVTLATSTVGAIIRFTTDGSTPTGSSTAYGGPIHLTSSATVKAIAIKNGMTTSDVASATYTLGGPNNQVWDGKTTFNLVNATRGKYSDQQVYWAIIGKSWQTGEFVHVDASGNLIPMSLGDNGALMKNGLPYSNYFYTLDRLRSVTIPAINSARLLISLGSPMYIWINQDVNGKIAYAGANIENPTDPNIDVVFDFGEFAILPPGSSPQGIFINTTRVDHFGFPLKLTVTGLDGFSQTVGEPLTETRDELFARFVTELPAPFRPLAQAPYAPYRIMAPAHSSFQKDGANETYLASYIDQVWQKYTNEDIVIDLKNGWAPFTGRVVGGVFRFTDGTGTYFINGKPSTSEVMLGNGLLDDPRNASDVGKQLQLQAQLCAALNRRVAHLAFNQWWNPANFYPSGQPANYYAKFWHDHSLNGLAYGFAYDDVGAHSPSIHTPKPVSVTYTIGW